MALEAVGDVPLGVYQQIARQTDNPLIRPTAGRERQFGGCDSRYVNANHCKITILKLPNVRATLAGGGFCSILVRVGSDAFQKHNRILVCFCSNSFCYDNVANKTHHPLTVKLVFTSMAKKRKIANVVGKEIQKRRYELDLTQEEFATKWDMIFRRVGRC